MPMKITLKYFNSRGRAEPIRMLLAAAKQKYEDVRLDQEEWKEEKANTPWGQLPVLEVDGKKIGDSGAILRFLARQFQFFGKNAMEAATIDSTCEQIIEILTKLVPLLMSKDDDKKKKESMMTFKDEFLILTLAKLEKALKKNKGGNGYFVGDKMSLADILLLHIVEIITSIPELSDAIKEEDYPKLMDLQQRVTNIPEIAAWLEKRPVTSN